MFLYQVVRIKGFCKIDGEIIHIEMTPEQMKEEEKFSDKLGVVVIGENKLLLDEFIAEFF